MTFLINQPINYNFPSFEKPTIIGHWSLNGNREYSQDISQLKYLYEPAKNQIGFELNKGINRVIRKPSGLNEHIDHLLRWILDNAYKIKADPKLERWLKPEFICYRGLITKICNSPYENRDGWIICAAKFHGTIYLSLFDTEQQKIKNANLTYRDLQFMSWGFKFEQYLMSDSPNTPPDTNAPVNESEEFSCVYYSKLGKNSLLYAAEMDGVESKDELQESNNLNKIKFVELKTNKMAQYDRRDKTYLRKILRWWCQSFLVGVENIICGLRTDHGRVVRICDIKIADLPKISQGMWNASHAMNFGCSFLDHVKSIVKNDYKDCIYKFEFQPGRDITCTILPGNCEFSFLRDWYVDKLKQIIDC